MLDSLGVKTVIRCVLLEWVNINGEHLTNVRNLFNSFEIAVRVDFLPCHSFGESKAVSLGKAVPKLNDFIPTKEAMEHVKSFCNWTKEKK